MQYISMTPKGKFIHLYMYVHAVQDKETVMIQSVLHSAV